jgi:hypothetical protein
LSTKLQTEVDINKTGLFRHPAIVNEDLRLPILGFDDILQTNKDSGLATNKIIGSNINRGKKQ